jgi:hypothetical protein
MSQGDLTGKSNENIEPNGSNRSDSNGIDYIKGIRFANERDNNKKKEKPDPHP